MDIMEEHAFDYAYGDEDDYFEYYHHIFHSRSFYDSSKIFIFSSTIHFLFLPLIYGVGLSFEYMFWLVCVPSQ
jgi:hypothetical protein